MRIIVQHEIKGRLRFSTGKRRLTNEDADMLLYYLYSLRQVIQALGNLRIPLLAAILQLVMRVITARFLPVLMGCAGIYYATPAAWAVTLILIGAMYPVQLKRCRQSMAGR